jgi:hypothetical protein
MPGTVLIAAALMCAFQGVSAQELTDTDQVPEIFPVARFSGAN